MQCKHLPVSITITGNDSDWENGVRTFEYDFNTDGTVKIEYYSEPNESPMKLYYSFGGTRMMSKGEDDFTFSSTYKSRLKRSVLSHFRTHFLQM